MSVIDEFNKYDELRNSLVEKFNDKNKSDTLSNADNLSFYREMRYIRRCMNKIMRANPDIKLKGTEYMYFTRAKCYIKWNYDDVC